MKIRDFKVPAREDFLKYDSWFEPFFSLMAPFIVDINRALQRRLSIPDNMNGEIIIRKFNSGISRNITIRNIVGRPLDVFVSSTNGVQLSMPILWSLNKPDEISITLNFEGNQTDVECRIIVLGA